MAPLHIYPAAAGLRSGGPPQPNGSMWLLVSIPTAANLQSIDLSDGRALGVVPVSAAATAVTELSTGVVAVGTGTATAGSVQLRNGTSGALGRTIALPGPVKALAAGADGVTLYALTGTTRSEAVCIVDTATGKVERTIPVSLGTVSLAAASSGSDIYALADNGQVTDYPATGGGPIASFSVGHSGLAEAMSPDGTALYVLKGTGATRNVAVVEIATESVRKVLPAATGAVGLSVSADGTTLYEVVGTSTYGNVQALPLAG